MVHVMSESTDSYVGHAICADYDLRSGLALGGKSNCTENGWTQSSHTSGLQIGNSLQQSIFGGRDRLSHTLLSLLQCRVQHLVVVVKITVHYDRLLDTVSNDLNLLFKSNESNLTVRIALCHCVNLSSDSLLALFETHTTRHRATDINAENDRDLV